MTSKKKYSLKISIENDGIYRIRLINANNRSEKVLFEFLSEKIPTVDKVVKLYSLSNNDNW